MFDRYVVVDWSASNQPKLGADSLWVADYCDGRMELNNFSTRVEVGEALRLILVASGAAKQRVLLGVDFALGYPAGAAGWFNKVAAPKNPPATSPANWESVWGLLHDKIIDDEGNRNNRFAVATALNRSMGTKAVGPFWGAPPRAVNEFLAATKPNFPFSELAEFRGTEHALVKSPKSVWQLLGVGAVGSQTLTGIPVLEKLRRTPALAPTIRVWPFETKFAAELNLTDPIVVVAEVWPALVPDDRMSQVDHLIKDARQVLALARWLSDLDASSELDSWLAVIDLAHDQRVRAIVEEGWILGAGVDLGVG